MAKWSTYVIWTCNWLCVKKVEGAWEEACYGLNSAWYQDVEGIFVGKNICAHNYSDELEDI